MEIILYDDVLPKLVCFLSPTLLKGVKIICILFLLLPKNWNYQTTYMCMYTLHSDEVVSLISGDESVVYSCSPMQWMLHSTAIPAIIIIMCCYKTVDLYWHLSLYLVSFCPKKNG